MKYGVKIKNFEAASIYEYENGFRSNLDEKDAMLTNSLFLDFLLNNKLNVYKEKSTRDIICLEFNYGTKDYDESILKINERIDKTDNIKVKYELVKIKNNIENNSENCIKITKQDLRIKYYTEGVTITYKTYNKQGEFIKQEPIHYQMLYRTPGKAKKGTCMFIRDELYDVAHNFLYMGIKLPVENSPIVEIGAYASLITSSIVGKIQIKPEEILIVKEFKTSMKTNVIKIINDENNHCVAETATDYNIVGEAFDGQALIDSSIFPEWADGYILLRHHMTKCAAFSTNIKQFMIDQFGDEYETKQLVDMFGNLRNVKDIKLITTENAIKWLKFKVSFDYWAKWVVNNNCMWGIVKTSHASKLGDVQRMSYQMVNALDMNSMASVTTKSVDYINKLKSDNLTFLEYLKKNATFSNDFDVLVALVEHNPKFIYSDYFRERKKEIIRTYVLNFKSGRSIQNADNLTIVGSPYAMLLYAIGKSPLDDITLSQEKGTIQCYTERFNDGEYLAEFRNPFNSRNNLGYIHNVYHEYFKKYFNLGKLCIAVNTINTDWQARNNGADQDSDSCYTTNQSDIVSHAKECYEKYPTIVNEIPPEKNIYNYSLKSYAQIDNTLTASQLAIGQSSNLAQLALTYTYNYDQDSDEYKKYYDYVCILSVIAQIAIDNAKRKSAINLETEIPRISSDMNIKTIGLPQFWEITKKDKRKTKNSEEKKKRDKENRIKIRGHINKELVCPMNYLYNLDLNTYRNNENTIPIENFFIKHQMDTDKRVSRKVEDLIEKYSLDLYNYNVNSYYDSSESEYLLLRSDFDDLINDIQKLYISRNYKGMMSWLIDRAFYITPDVKGKAQVTNSNTHKNRALLLKVLYSVNKDVFLSCFVN